MKDLTLVIMAAGMGSRFGGLKQIEPIGPNGEFIIDYSIYDAIKAGFNKVVLVIKEENYQIIKDTVGKRIENHIKVEYVFQKNDVLPVGYDLNITREKPLGTAHAIYCCKDVVKENFVIINADDFYGRDAYFKAAEFLRLELNDDTKTHFCSVGYQVANTMTENGSVKRGVINQENGFLTSLIESSIERVDDKIIASPLDGAPSFEIEEDTLVSMNLFGFTKEIFPYIEEKLKLFLDVNKDNFESCEFYIPNVVYDAITEGFSDVKVINTTAVWHGVTYRADKELVVDAIKNEVSLGNYPVNLWN